MGVGSTIAMGLSIRKRISVLLVLPTLTLWLLKKENKKVHLYTSVLTPVTTGYDPVSFFGVYSIGQHLKLLPNIILMLGR